MCRPGRFLIAGVCLAVALGLGMTSSSGSASASKAVAPVAALPIGKWQVAFTNGVIEKCDIFEFDGLHITVDEPARRARGIVATDGGSFVMKFHDNRVERWTAIRDRFVVEHFFPGAAFPSGRPVLGIAERAR